MSEQYCLSMAPGTALRLYSSARIAQVRTRKIALQLEQFRSNEVLAGLRALHVMEIGVEFLALLYHLISACQSQQNTAIMWR